jgi:NADH:ubiquinone oxidoreductase subunit F (NADH-binding)
MLLSKLANGYFPGGASGGILPESMADIPMDFDTLNEHGCFIGAKCTPGLLTRPEIEKERKPLRS